jgi:hypothetical protein
VKRVTLESLGARVRVPRFYLCTFHKLTADNFSPSPGAAFRSTATAGLSDPTFCSFPILKCGFDKVAGLQRVSVQPVLPYHLDQRAGPASCRQTHLLIKRPLQSIAAGGTARHKRGNNRNSRFTVLRLNQNASRRPARRTPKSSSHVRFQGKADMARRMDAIISAAFDPEQT